MTANNRTTEDKVVSRRDGTSCDYGNMEAVSWRFEVYVMERVKKKRKEEFLHRILT